MESTLLRTNVPVFCGVFAIAVTLTAFAQQMDVSEAVPVSAELRAAPGDIVRSFHAANGKDVRVIVQHPRPDGKTSQPYSMRAMLKR
jgi:uncharacterized membrane protein YdfJ with MMPL/SSD domain